MMKTTLALATASALALTACTAPGVYNPNANAATGAVAGALAGAILGAASADNDKTKGAVIGALVGAAAGTAIGYSLDKQAADLRASLGNANITVTNMGNYLVVNMPQDLLFATDSATLRPDLTSDLRAVASNLLTYPNSRIEVIGHTDNSGTAAYNMDLSERRAISVAAVLRASGVPSSRLSAYGWGEDQPIATNLSASGMAANRRVEIIIRPIR